MKIQKFNELYEQNPKQDWGSDTDKTNYYTFTSEITVRANSQEEAEDKMEFIANQNPDVELGIYNLNYATEGGKGRVVGQETSDIQQNVMESKDSKIKTKEISSAGFKSKDGKKVIKKKEITSSGFKNKGK